MQIDRIRVPGDITPEKAGNSLLAEKCNTSKIYWQFYFYNCSALIFTVLTRHLHVVVVGWSVLLESTF